MSEHRLNYPIRTAKVILCGGGGLLIQGMFKREIKRLIVIDDTFANAKVGESILVTQTSSKPVIFRITGFHIA